MCSFAYKLSNSSLKQDIPVTRQLYMCHIKNKYLINSLHGNFACFFVVCGFFFKINFFKNIFQENHQSVKQFGSRSGPMFCWA